MCVCVCVCVCINRVTLNAPCPGVSNFVHAFVAETHALARSPSLYIYICMYVCIYIYLIIYVFIYQASPTSFTPSWPRPTHSRALSLYICICICM